MPGKEWLPPDLHDIIENSLLANTTLSEWLVRVSEYPSVEAITNRKDKLFWEVVTAVRRLDLDAAEQWARELFPGRKPTFYEVLCQNLIDEMGALRAATVQHAKLELLPLQEEIQHWLGELGGEDLGISLEHQPELIGALPNSPELESTSLHPRADTLLRIIALLNSTPSDRALAESLLIDLFPGKSETFYDYCVDDLLLLPSQLREFRAPDIERLEADAAQLLELWQELLQSMNRLQASQAPALLLEWQELQDIYNDAWYDFQIFRYNDAYSTAEDQYQAAVDAYFLDGARVEHTLLEALTRLEQFQQKIQGK